MQIRKNYPAIGKFILGAATGISCKNGSLKMGSLNYGNIYLEGAMVAIYRELSTSSTIYKNWE